MHGHCDETGVLSRRRALGALGALGVLPLAACGGGGSDTSGTTTTTTSSNAALGALAVSAGSLSPSFAGTTASYTVTVDHAVTSIALTPTAADSLATITLDGTAVASGTASAAIALKVGTNTLRLVVAAPNGTTTQTYTIAVVRSALGIDSSCVLIPSETQGPYPLLAVLSNTAVVRQDIAESKTGVPLSLSLSLKNLNIDCEPVVGAAVYIWHCDKDGAYSGYSSTQNGNHAGETFLRGVQVSDAQGQVTFKTIYPGWYPGRITHIHFQVYLNNQLGGTAVATSQLAFPAAATTAVYDSSLYSGHGQNSSVTSFDADMVFSDGTSYQLLSLSGDTSSGYTASLTVGIAG